MSLLKEFIDYWIKENFGGKIKPRKMANPVITVEKILSELNKEDEQKPWVHVPGIHSVRGVRVTDNHKLEDTDSGFVLKFFVNKKTGEVKSFYAKYTDDSEAMKLL